MSEFSVTVEGVEQLRRRLGVVLSGERRKAMSEHVGRYVLEKVKDHLDEMSATRHRVADRLGAAHSHYLEYASGRAGGVTKDGDTQDVIVKDPTESSVTISIRNTPGLRRAFHDLTIVPRRAKALTIPLHRISYNKGVKDLRGEGHDLFRLGKSNVLAENDGTTETYTDENGKKRKRKGVRPLYCLVRRAVVPKDTGLLPTREDYANWGRKAVKGFLRAEAI